MHPPVQEMQKTEVPSLGGEEPLEEDMPPTHGESHGQRGLAGTVHGLQRAGQD